MPTNSQRPDNVQPGCGPGPIVPLAATCRGDNGSARSYLLIPHQQHVADRVPQARCPPLSIQLIPNPPVPRCVLRAVARILSTEAAMRKPTLGQPPAVALIDPKYPHNVGAALRACSCWGLAQLWWTGDRVTLDLRRGQR